MKKKVFEEKGYSYWRNIGFFALGTGVEWYLPENTILASTSKVHSQSIACSDFFFVTPEIKRHTVFFPLKVFYAK